MKSKLSPRVGSFLLRVKRLLKANWLGISIIVLATVIFFWPVIIRAGSYTDGGDAMFNAWTLARDQHCILRQDCPDYINGNIYFPHKDTMLYSETQLSAGLVTLPLYLINKNPIFSYNVWTIVSCLLSGLFMFFLAKYLSKGRNFLPIVAGLVFEFAPLKMAALGHLQNLSIFCLPLAVLLILKFLERRSKNYLWLLLLVLVYQFYASWYQMIFVLFAIGTMLLALYVFRLANWRRLLMVGAIVGLAALSTFPLAKEYMRFSKTNNASFGITEQTMFSSSVADYFIPQYNTLEGRIYYKERPTARVNAYNLDSYSYAGLILYTVAGATVLIAFIALCRRRAKRVDREVLVFASIGLVGLVASFGPLLKVTGSFTYPSIVRGMELVIPMPYIIIDKLLPQLHFIRAVGRISVLFLFALCCLLAYLSLFLDRTSLSKLWKRIIQIAVVSLIIVELMPTKIIGISSNSYSYGLQVPDVYKFISKDQKINDIVVIRADADYPKAVIPTARAEDVLWAGYHNRNIFNGYSGYEPPSYGKQYADFVDFQADDVPKLKKLGIDYVLVDKQLSTSNPQLSDTVNSILPNKVYEDNRYALFKI